MLADESDKEILKWPMQSLASILQLQKRLGDQSQSTQLQEIYRELIQIDPYREGFYEDALKQLETS